VILQSAIDEGIHELAAHTLIFTDGLHEPQRDFVPVYRHAKGDDHFLIGKGLAIHKQTDQVIARKRPFLELSQLGRRCLNGTAWRWSKKTSQTPRVRLLRNVHRNAWQCRPRRAAATLRPCVWGAASGDTPVEGLPRWLQRRATWAPQQALSGPTDTPILVARPNGDSRSCPFCDCISGPSERRPHSARSLTRRPDPAGSASGSMPHGRQHPAAHLGRPPWTSHHLPRPS